MTVTDYGGTWEYKGTVTPPLSIPPNLYNWARFPNLTTAGNGSIRLTYYGLFNQIKTYGYIRPVYDFGNLAYGKWRRIYPKEETEFLTLDLPEEISVNSDAIPRYFEVTKVWKRRYRGYGTYQDYPWSVGLEVLEEPALPAELADLLLSNPGSVVSLGNSGNYVILINPEQESP
jgi:hypothetical protein